jgi:hypothetical protein
MEVPERGNPETMTTGLAGARWNKFESFNGMDIFSKRQGIC